MGRPRSISDQSILTTARAVFLELGPGASTTVVAERLGVSQAALFKRFGTKAELMVAALAPPGLPSWVAAVAEGPQLDRCFKDQLCDVGSKVMSFFVEMVPCFMTLSAAGLDPQRLLHRFEVPPPVQAHTTMVEWLERAMASGLIRPGDATSIAYAFLGSFHMRAFTAHISGQRPTAEQIEAYASDAVAALWAGISPSLPEDI